MSKRTLFVHTVVFFVLVIGCFLSPLIAYAYPEAFRFYALWVFGGIGVLILGSWYVYGGDCPLTVWENNFRKREGRKTYAGSCIDHYAKRWFGLTLPRHFSGIFPVAILLIPLLTRFFF